MLIPPLSLYIHIPWCIRKCPYCDFNSHKSPDSIPEQEYIAALVYDLQNDLEKLSIINRPLISIFIGGGTPSLFSAKAYEVLFSEIKKCIAFAPHIEITLEANPGTLEQNRFKEYRQLGINRLSLGIQSFNPVHLKALGRIHDEVQAHKAIEAARNAGFSNINLDLMHGLPKQSIEEGLKDLESALAHQPEHLSWYQLTIEPNTVFYKKTPALPSEDDSWTLEQQGFELLKHRGYTRYEISAFEKEDKQSHHNLNYWLFGDYLGIGAGAHGKVSQETQVIRTRKHRLPKEYLSKDKKFQASSERVSSADLVFEFMLNTTRLNQEIPLDLFTQRTGLDINFLLPKLKEAQRKELIVLSNDSWQVTDFGRLYTNSLQTIFLP